MIMEEQMSHNEIIFLSSIPILSTLQSGQHFSGGRSTRWSLKRRPWSSAARCKEIPNPTCAGGRMMLMFLAGGMFIPKDSLTNSQTSMCSVLHYEINPLLVCVCAGLRVMWQAALHAEELWRHRCQSEWLFQTNDDSHCQLPPGCQGTINSPIRLYTVHSTHMERLYLWLSRKTTPIAKTGVSTLCHVKEEVYRKTNRSGARQLKRSDR